MNRFLPLLLGYVLVSCVVSIRADAEFDTTDSWRRTTRGWERTDYWRFDVARALPPAKTAAIHPLIIATLQLLISLGALLACPHPQSRPARRAAKAAAASLSSVSR